MVCDVVDGVCGSGGGFFDDALRWRREELAGYYKTRTREQVYCNVIAGSDDSKQGAIGFRNETLW